MFCSVLFCADPTCDSDSTRSLSAGRRRRLRQTVLDQAGVLCVWIQDLPDHLDQVRTSLSGLHLVSCSLRDTHTHNRFTALLESVRDYPGEQAPER